MINSSDPILDEDIRGVYAAQGIDVQRAVTNILLSGGNMISMSFAGITDENEPMVHVDWKANPEMSMMMVSLLVRVGEKRFGEIWRDQLLTNIVSK